MTIATIIITDSKDANGADTIEVEGRLDPPTALDLPPSPAVILGSYLAANMEQVSRDAMSWFRAMALASVPPEDVPVVKAPKIILPDDQIKGSLQ